MKFHFEFTIPKSANPIRYGSRNLLIGSCFTEHIGEKFRYHKFQVMENPHGILFNPVSVAEAITDYIDQRIYTAADIFQLNETWHSWKHHSRFSGITPDESLHKINASIQEAHQHILHADNILITLGSAWTYQLTDQAPLYQQGKVAANNHKAPANWFQRHLMTYEEVLQVLDNMLHRIFYANPHANIIFTISPVRHLREGVVENNRSKAVLIQAVHHLVDKFEQLYYFPAYELVIDDLRDYRFYAEDLVHPNYQATQYVWEKFTEACIDPAAHPMMKEIASIQLAVKHRPFNPETAMHKKFLEQNLQKATTLQAQYPYLDLQQEISFFQQALA